MAINKSSIISTASYFCSRNREPYRARALPNISKIPSSRPGNILVRPTKPTLDQLDDRHRPLEAVVCRFFLKKKHPSMSGKIASNGQRAGIQPESGEKSECVTRVLTYCRKRCKKPVISRKSVTTESRTDKGERVEFAPLIRRIPGSPELDFGRSRRTTH